MFDRLAESSRLEYGPPATRAFVIAALLVIGISLLPGSDLLDIEPWETLEHIIAYAGLAFVGILAFPQRRAVVLLAVLLPALGGVVELCQLVVPGRSANIDDAIANTLGVALVLIPVFVWRGLWRR
jgi:hypothetical protein